MANPKNRSDRVGLGVGLGMGYRNLAPADSHIHYLSGKGVKIYKPFFRGIKMSHSPIELTLYVPATQGEKDIVDTDIQKVRIEDAERTMSTLFRGTTEVSAVGRWINDDKELVREPIGKITSYTTPERFESRKSKFEDYVKDIARRYNQSSIALEFEGDMFLYNNPDAKKEETK
jgi:hypothetical protein